MIARLSLLWRRFSPLEERLLAEIRNVLPSAALPTFDAQVTAINRVQRLPPSWTEISFYRMRRGTVNWRGVPTFPCTDAFRVAEVRFQVAGKAYRAVLQSVGGHIFELAVVPGPKVASFAKWDAEPSVTLLADPMSSSVGRTTEELPPAWRAFLEAGKAAPDWTLYDESTAYRVTLDDGEYLLLAEREGEEFLLHRVEPPAEGFVLHRLHDPAPPQAIEGGLAAVIERAPNKRMKLSKRDDLGGNWPIWLGVMESRFAAYPPCYPDLKENRYQQSGR